MWGGVKISIRLPFFSAETLALSCAVYGSCRSLYRVSFIYDAEFRERCTLQQLLHVSSDASESIGLLISELDTSQTTERSGQ